MKNDNYCNEPDDNLIELRNLLNEFMVGKLTGKQDERLQQLAIESKAARRLYLKYLFMHGTIHQEYCNREKFQVSLPPIEYPTLTQNDSLSQNDSIFPLLSIENDLLSSCHGIDKFGADTNTLQNNNGLVGIFNRINFSFVPGLIMTIAFSLILFVVVILPFYWAIQPEDPSQAMVARITKTLDCQWGRDEKWQREGTVVTAGQMFDLEAGFVEIEFVSGTKVILQGPAQYVVSGDNASRLDMGQLAAVVPKWAEGFSVKTPSMNVVDLGTEFGVAVNTADRADLHVFKGLVEMEVGSKSDNQKKVQLKKNEAVEYSKKSGDITHVPIDNKKFIRDLVQYPGITANLQVTNGSFEVPDIRAVAEYQPMRGNTLLRPIYGWKMAGYAEDTSRIVMCQISPYKSSLKGCDVGPGATDGRQVATLSLGVRLPAAGQLRSNWMYQSLGLVSQADIGKTLKLSVDAGPRNAYEDFHQGNGTISAGFALNVTQEQIGTFLGQPGSFQQEGEVKQLSQINAIASITEDLVGQEVFIVLMVSDHGSDQNVDQYHFDNVRLFVEE